MFVDLLGKTRLKLGLHVHTDISDGEKAPHEAANMYREEGYDAIAITDHWNYFYENEISGLKIIPGCEYDTGGYDGTNGVYHIVGIGMTSDPKIPAEWKSMVKTSEKKAADIIKAIHLYNGYAILAHPAWSLNTPEKLMEIRDFDGIEIYNAVSEWGNSDRAYSSSEVDGVAVLGKYPGVLATDDTHYYEYDFARSAVMVEAVDMETSSIVRALQKGRFYSTQGPEIHLIRTAPDKVKVICSPVEKIVFFSNVVWTQGRVVRGDGLVEAEFSVTRGDRFIRAEVTDSEGKKAWSNFIDMENMDY